MRKIKNDMNKYLIKFKCKIYSSINSNFTFLRCFPKKYRTANAARFILFIRILINKYFYKHLRNLLSSKTKARILSNTNN